MPKFRLLPLTLCALFCAAVPAQAQQVYVGVADQWDDLVKNPDEWKFVRANADGFYVNFIEMSWQKTDPDGAKAARLAKTASLFTHKNAILESDNKDATFADDQLYLKELQAVGFTVPLASLNYGWNKERSDNLENFALRPGQAPRPVLVQQGPWVLSGDINLKNGENDAYRANVDQADGISTDGPMGFWLSNQGGMREGSFSMVKYAHAHGQKALVMLCPYGAGNTNYAPAQALAVSEECVRDHEDAGAIPDIWAVFEYATSIAAIPEQVDGAPISSTTGMAYWLIHHLQDPEGAARFQVEAQPGLKTSTHAPTKAQVTDKLKVVDAASLKLAAGGAPGSVTYLLKNSSSWLDLCPLLRAQSSNANWNVSASLDGVDVTDTLFKVGVACVKAFRLMHQGVPAADHRLKFSFSPKTPLAGKVGPLDISLMLSPHPSFADRVVQRLELHVTAQP